MVTGLITASGVLLHAVPEDLNGLATLTAVLQPQAQPGDTTTPPSHSMVAMLCFGRGLHAMAQRDAAAQDSQPGQLYTVRATSAYVQGGALYLLGANGLQLADPAPARARCEAVPA